MCLPICKTTLYNENWRKRSECNTRFVSNLTQVLVRLYMGTDEYETVVACSKSVEPMNIVGGYRNQYCLENSQPIEYSSFCRGTIHIWVQRNDSGLWYITSLYGLRYQKKVISVGPPQISRVGPVLINQLYKRKVLIKPKYNLVRVVMSLPVSVATVQKKCQPFVETAMTGWNNQIKDFVPKPKVMRKKDLTVKVLGGLGFGLGINNSVDAESLAYKELGSRHCSA